MSSPEAMRNVDRVARALDEKGFAAIFATHQDNTPAGLVVLRDDHGREARGESEAIAGLIRECDDLAGLWDRLADSGMGWRPPRPAPLAHPRRRA